MTDEKKPSDAVIGASSLRWAVARSPSGRPIELTIYDGGTAANIRLTPYEADFIALTLLTNTCSDFDAVATAQRLSDMAGQIVTHRYDDFSLAELAVSDDVIGDAAGTVFEGMANGG